MNVQDNQQDKSYPFAITFIDPLFAIALHLGFSHGLFQETWFTKWQRPSGTEAFSIGVFALGFLTIALAWLGYHRSISRRPLRGLARFAIDVLLVMVYAAILMKFNNFGAVLLLLSMTYLLYLLWDFAKVVEYGTDYASMAFSERYSGVCVDLLWLIVFGGLLIAHRTQFLRDGIVLTCAFVACLGHRINKVMPIWTSVAKGIKRVLFSGREMTQEPASPNKNMD